MLDDVKAAVAEAKGYMSEIESTISEVETVGVLKPKHTKAIRNNAKEMIVALKNVRAEAKAANLVAKEAKKKAKEDAE